MRSQLELADEIPVSTRTKYAEVPDAEVVELAQHGVEDASEHLLYKYRNLVRSRARLPISHRSEGGHTRAPDHNSRANSMPWNASPPATSETLRLIRASALSTDFVLQRSSSAISR